MRLKWLPWRLILSRLARSSGFIDPVALLSRMHRFAQPAEVTEPIELLRAGVVFHARGLINTRTIQHNLDWVWPYWIERQFDPQDPSFIPRAFSITHVNLTHRNWTAVGQPDCDWLPIVDPRGLVTPLFDGWSLDLWVLPDGGERLLPSRAERAAQWLRLEEVPAVETHLRQDGSELRSIADVVWEGDQPSCRVRASGMARDGGWLAVAVRPVNPEGISFIERIALEPDRSTLRINRDANVHLEGVPDRVCMSHYRRGDVLQDLGPGLEATSVACDVGLATAAALYRLEPQRPAEVVARVPLVEARHPDPLVRGPAVLIPERPTAWPEALEGACTLEVPDATWQSLFDAAVRSLILHSPGEVYPGPYTYKRFWFRDAAFILEALLVVGLVDRARRTIMRFPERQDRRGYFHSQAGEWDSNGEAIWIIDRYRRLAGAAFARGAGRVSGRRRPVDPSQAAPRRPGRAPRGADAGRLQRRAPRAERLLLLGRLLVGGRAAVGRGDPARGRRRPGAGEYLAEVERLLAAVERSLRRTAPGRGYVGIPASPHRRMDSGAVGSLAASYPLRLWEPRDPRMMATVEFLLNACTVRGGFFQDMIHSGINAYLTLHLAQVLLRAGDGRHEGLIRAVAELASPTGQWPEAIHPHTGGGCMGDGQHVWAAAEWVLMMRSLFVREEGDRLVLGSGLPPAWLGGRGAMRLGPTPTPYGPVTVRVEPHDDGTHVRWEAAWRVRRRPSRSPCPAADPSPSTATSGPQPSRRLRGPTGRGWYGEHPDDDQHLLPPGGRRGPLHRLVHRGLPSPWPPRAGRRPDV